MKSLRITIISSVVLILLIVVVWVGRDEIDKALERKRMSNSIASLQEIETMRIREEKTEIAGMYLSSMDSVLSSTDSNIITAHDKILIYYYKEGDCSGCVNDGFRVFDEANTVIAGRVPTTVVFSTWKEQLDSINTINGPIKNFFIDHDDAIHREMRYFYTPVLILFDNGYRIKDVFYPARGTSEELESEFLANVYLETISTHDSELSNE